MNSLQILRGKQAWLSETFLPDPPLSYIDIFTGLFIMTLVDENYSISLVEMIDSTAVHLTDYLSTSCMEK